MVRFSQWRTKTGESIRVGAAGSLLSVGQGFKSAGGSADRFRVSHSMLMMRVPRRSGSFRGVVLMSSAALILGGCASLPVSGPTGHEVRTAAIGKAGHYPFTLIDVDMPAAIPPAPAVPVPALAALPPRPTDLLGPGDVLNISIYEAGVSLFGTALRSAAAAGAGADTASSAERLPPARVDDYGY